jgi:hypothetical protein
MILDLLPKNDSFKTLDSIGIQPIHLFPTKKQVQLLKFFLLVALKMIFKKDKIKGLVVIGIAWLIALSLLYLTLVKFRILTAI